MDYKCQKCGKTSHNSYMYTHLLNVDNFTDDVYARDTSTTNSIWLHYFVSKPEIYTICKHCIKTTTVLELLKSAVDIEYKQQKK